jgi:hypothetical protein
MAPSSTNLPPIAQFVPSVRGGALPLSVTFNAAGSSDPNPGDRLSYSWDLNGDGVYGDATGVTATRSYTVFQSVDVGLRVTDLAGNVATTHELIYPGNQSPAIQSVTTNVGSGWTVGQTVQFSANVTDDYPLPTGAYNWELILHHCAVTNPADCHAHVNVVGALSGSPSGSFVVPDHEYPTWLELKLTVTDASGASSVNSTRLDPKTATVSVNSNLAGVAASVGATEGTTPFQMTALAGSTLGVSAPQTVVSGGVTWKLQSSPAKVVAAATGTTVTLTYVQDPTAPTPTTTPAPPTTAPAPAPAPVPAAPVIPSSSPFGAVELSVAFGPQYSIITGWAYDDNTPVTGTSVQVFVNNVLAGEFPANRERPNSGPYGFAGALLTPGPVSFVCAFAMNTGPYSENQFLGCTVIDRRPKVAKKVTKKKTVKKKTTKK